MIVLSCAFFFSFIIIIIFVFNSYFVRVCVFFLSGLLVWNKVVIVG